jgi:hypothetical protein
LDLYARTWKEKSRKPEEKNTFLILKNGTKKHVQISMLSESRRSMSLL